MLKNNNLIVLQMLMGGGGSFSAGGPGKGMHTRLCKFWFIGAVVSFLITFLFIWFSFGYGNRFYLCMKLHILITS